MKKFSLGKGSVAKYIEIKANLDYKLTIDTPVEIVLGKNSSVFSLGHIEYTDVELEDNDYDVIINRSITSKKTLCLVENFILNDVNKDYFGAIHFAKEVTNYSDFDIVISAKSIHNLKSSQTNIVLNANDLITKDENCIHINTYDNLYIFENFRTTNELIFRVNSHDDADIRFITFSKQLKSDVEYRIFVCEKLTNGKQICYKASFDSKKRVFHKLKNDNCMSLACVMIANDHRLIGEVFQKDENKLYTFATDNTFAVTGKYLSFKLQNETIEEKNNFTIDFDCETSVISLFNSTIFWGENTYRNILVPKGAKTVTLPACFSYADVMFTKERKRTVREERLGNNILNKVTYYQKKGNRKKLLVTFPGFAENGKAENQFPITFSKSKEYDFYNCHFLSFLDENSAKGTYMQYNDDFELCKQSIINVIKNKLNELNITVKNL